VTCFHPVTAFQQLEGGAILFVERKNCRKITFSCGRCIGCRIRRQQDWALRIILESKLHRYNCFLTLTYDEDHYPRYGSLNYRHWQLFAKKLRKKIGPFRFFVAGEYGAKLSRPHYHACLFGAHFPDMEKCNSLRSKHDLFTSNIIGDSWGRGFHSFGELTMASARYAATYCIKKISGPLAEDHYSRVDTSTGEIVKLEPEFARMSLRPGLGYEWIKKYWPEVFASGRDAIIVDGKNYPVPRYFSRSMDDSILPSSLLLDAVEYDRSIRAVLNSGDSTPDRLAVREAVVKSRKAFFEGMYNQGVIE